MIDTKKVMTLAVLTSLLSAGMAFAVVIKDNETEEEAKQRITRNGPPIDQSIVEIDDDEAAEELAAVQAQLEKIKLDREKIEEQNRVLELTKKQLKEDQERLAEERKRLEEEKTAVAPPAHKQAIDRAVHNTTTEVQRTVESAVSFLSGHGWHHKNHKKDKKGKH